MLVAAYALLGTGSAIGNLAPSSCSFDLGIGCQNIALVSNTTSTFFAFIGNNEQEYPINNLRLNLFFGGKSVTPQCTTGRINPGETFVCFAKTALQQRPGTVASGNLTARVGYCSLSGGDCSGGQISETYVGTYNSPVGSSNANVGLVFSNAFVKSDGQIAVNVSFNLLGYGLFLATVSLNPRSGSSPTITDSGPGSASLSLSAGTLADYCAALVNITYANMTGTYAVALNSSNYNQSSYKLSSNTNNACLSLLSATKTVSISGKNNTAGLFTLSDVLINVSSTGSQNNLAIFNSNATLKVEGNYNNITMYNSTVVLSIEGTYNRVAFINSRISNLTASGNNNLVILQNTTVAHESVTGTNDVIQKS